ncbi:ATP-binding protein [Lishizhenia sp.]|uniref:ATP-binding protein n=1 Tax=Lishizhenia sp. TaxID=2497594 RepID=UPI00299F48F9|nr:ATP-binding protein [Lishizhenia sp.]MDX1444866.1 ATP-binding protein [Lishizhenia sp.]
MRFKKYILLGLILLLVVISNAEFIMNQNKIHNKYRQWTKQANVEKLQSETILYEYYQNTNSENVQFNLDNSIQKLQEMNNSFMANNTCEEYINFKTFINEKIVRLKEVYQKNNPNTTPFIFTNIITGIQEQLDLIIEHFEKEESNKIAKVHLFQILFNIMALLIVSYLFYSGILRSERKWASLKEEQEASINTLRSQQTQIGENVFVQSSTLKEHIENLEALIRSSEQFTPEVQDLIEDNLYEIKNTLNSMNLYFQSNVQEKNLNTNLTPAFIALINYFDLENNVHGIPKEDIWVKCDSQDILLFLKFLFKTIKENKKENENLHITLEEKRTDEFVEIVIRDNGKGIHPDVMPKLFQLNPTLENDRNYNTSLTFQFALLQKIINDYQGEFKVDSEWNKGTTYRFKLALA